MSGNLMDEELNYTQLIDIDKDDCSHDSLSILHSSYFSNSLNETDCDLLKNENKLENIDDFNLVEPTKSTNEIYDKFSKDYYYKYVKPQFPNLDDSFVAFFADSKPKGPDFAKAYVAKRIAVALAKIKKSLSCSNLNEVDNALHKSFNVVDSNGTLSSSSFRRSLTDLHNNTYNKTHKNNSKISSGNLPQIFSESIEGLNYVPSETFVKFQRDKGSETYSEATTHKLHKSFSFSGFSGIDKNESLLDVELKLEDSVPSEDEKDEMGLPIKKIFFSRTPPKKEQNLSKVMKKFKRILRSSFGELNYGSDGIDSVGAPLENKNLETVKDPPLLPVEQDYNILMKKTSSVTTKGPMKAFVPLQDMTKQIGLQLVSPVKKAKEKKNDVSLKNTSSILGESFNERTPVASSTPSSDDRANRSSYRKSKNTSRRSLSEGRTPTKQKGEPAKDISYIKENTSQRPLTMDDTRTVHTNKKECDSNEINFPVATNQLNQGFLSKLKLTRNTTLKRPSSASSVKSNLQLGTLTTFNSMKQRSDSSQSNVGLSSTTLRKPSATIKAPMTRTEVPRLSKASTSGISRPSTAPTSGVSRLSTAPTSGLTSSVLKNKNKGSMLTNSQSRTLKTFNAIDKRCAPVLTKLSRASKGSLVGKENK